MRFDCAILRLAACLLPGRERAEWLAEWNSELWYVRERGGRRAASFALGAFRDAWWLRRNSPPPPGPPWCSTLRLQSPAQCLGFLVLMAAAFGLLAVRLPRVRTMIVPVPYRAADHLIMIPRVAVEDYRRLKNQKPRPLGDVAFYRVVRQRAGTTQLSIAVASENLFGLLGIPAPRAHAVIPATVSAGSWLPGPVDGWLLDDRLLSSLPSGSQGFAIGRLKRAHGYRAARISLDNANGGRDWFDCSPLVDEPPIPAFLAIAMFALVLVPATTSLNLGEYPAKPCYRRWFFLAAKFVLVTPVVLFGTLSLGSFIATAIQPHGLLVGYVLAYRWVFIDQRQRCPECLRLLTHPMHIGQPSRIFLEWYGTEFVCMKGHGLLHVPETPTISFATQRWVHLDPSWSVLFPRAAAHAGKTGIT